MNDLLFEDQNLDIEHILATGLQKIDIFQRNNFRKISNDSKHSNHIFVYCGCSFYNEYAILALTSGKQIDLTIYALHMRT